MGGERKVMERAKKNEGWGQVRSGRRACKTFFNGPVLVYQLLVYPLVDSFCQHDMRLSCQSALWRTRFTRAKSRNPSYVVFCKNVPRFFQK